MTQMTSDSFPMSCLPPGTHAFHMWTCAKEHATTTTTFLCEGIRANEKTIYLFHRTPKVKVIERLRPRLGENLARTLMSGQLLILPAMRVFAPDGQFNTERMLAKIQDCISQAREEGYSGLRATCESGWSRLNVKSGERLLEYEMKIDAEIRGKNAVILCQYGRADFGPISLLRNFCAHRTIALWGRVVENPLWCATEQIIQTWLNCPLIRSMDKTRYEQIAMMEDLTSSILDLVTVPNRRHQRFHYTVLKSFIGHLSNLNGTRREECRGKVIEISARQPS